jgi:aminoglycoside 2'-N-acetyltransferase I
MAIRVAHTSDLSQALRDEIWELLVDVFEGDIEDSDWEHGLGGVHALAYDDGGELVGHASVIQRRLLHGDRALRTGYVEAVGVREHARRHGHASALMEAIERVIRGAYELGALGTSDMALAFYRGRGWLPWEGETYALTPRGTERTPDDDDALHVLEVSAELDRTGAITCDWRDGAPW